MRAPPPAAQATRDRVDGCLSQSQGNPKVGARESQDQGRRHECRLREQRRLDGRFVRRARAAPLWRAYERAGLLRATVVLEDMELCLPTPGALSSVVCSGESPMLAVVNAGQVSFAEEYLLTARKR